MRTESIALQPGVACADSALRYMRGHRGLALVLLCLVAAACTGRTRDRASGQAVALQGKGDATRDDPCSLLDVSDVAAAIGPLAGPPYRGDPNPDPSSDVCRYETNDYRRIQLSVDWTGGAMAMKMVALGRRLGDKALQAETQTGIVLKAGDTLRGDWDQIALSPASCCSLDALRGDADVQLDWTGTRLTIAAAGALLNSAIRRLNHRLAIDGTAGEAAAKQRWAAMAQDSALDACGLVSQQDAEAIIGTPLSVPPDHGSAQEGPRRTSCYYRTPMPNAPNAAFVYEIDLKEWSDAHAKFAEDEFVINGAVGGIRRQWSGGDSTTPAEAPEPPGPWDEIGSSVSGGYQAVKGPLLLAVSTNGDHTRARALLAKAVSALQ